MKFVEELLKELVKRFNKKFGGKGLAIEYQGNKIILVKNGKELNMLK